MSRKIIGVELVARHCDIARIFNVQGNEIVGYPEIHATAHGPEQYECLLYRAADSLEKYGVRIHSVTGLPLQAEVCASPNLRTLIPTIAGQAGLSARGHQMQLFQVKNVAPARTQKEILFDQQRKLKVTRDGWAAGRVVSAANLEAIIANQSPYLERLALEMAIKEASAYELGILVDPTLDDVVGSTILDAGFEESTYEMISDATPFGDIGLCQLFSNTLLTQRRFYNRYKNRSSQDGVPLRVSTTHGRVVIGKCAIAKTWSKADFGRLAQRTYADLKREFGPSYGNGSAQLLVYFDDDTIEVKERIIVPTGIQKPGRDDSPPSLDMLHVWLSAYRRGKQPAL